MLIHHIAYYPYTHVLSSHGVLHMRITVDLWTVNVECEIVNCETECENGMGKIPIPFNSLVHSYATDSIE